MANSPAGNAARIISTASLAYATSAVNCAAFSAQTYQLRLVADSACNVLIGDGATTATTASMFLPANWETIIGCTPGQRLSVVRAASDGLVTATSGTLWITELSV